MRLDVISKYAIKDNFGRILCYDVFSKEIEFVKRGQVNDFYLEIQYFYEEDLIRGLERSILERFPHGEAKYLTLNEENLKAVEIRTISDNSFLEEFFVDTKIKLPESREVYYRLVLDDGGKIFGMDPKSKEPRFMYPSESTPQTIFPFWCDSKEKLMRFLSSGRLTWKCEDLTMFKDARLQETHNIDCYNTLWCYYFHPLALWGNEGEEEKLLEDQPKTYVLARQGDREFLCKDAKGNQVFLGILEINQENLVTFTVPDKFLRGCYYREVIFKDDRITLL